MPDFTWSLRQAQRPLMTFETVHNLNKKHRFSGITSIPENR